MSSRSLSLSLPCLIVAGIVPQAAAPAQTRPTRPERPPAEVNPPQDTPPTPAAPTTETTDKATPPTARGLPNAESEGARFAGWDRLRTQGQTSDYPGIAETVTRDMGGIRTWLNDHDLYFRGVSSNNITYDVNNGRSPLPSQVYTGDRLTLSQSDDLRLSWKIGGSGNDITQINVGGLINLTSWRQNGPTGARFTTLGFYSSLFDRRIELKGGFGGNISDFVGIFSGGNPILANGLAASIPISTGMSGGTIGTPTFNVQLNGADGLYSKSAIQRSVTPAGLFAETDRAGLGLKFTQDGARPLFIQEFGVRRPASKTGRQIWLRAGGSYNLSQYTRFDGRGTRRNWMLYALADYQIYQPDREGASYRGIYVGASALFAPQAVNTYSRSLEARVYALGMIPGRPTDQMTLTIGLNRFSRSSVDAFLARGQIAHRKQFSVGTLYAFHVTHGLFVSPSVTYIRNPSIAGDFKPAVNFGLAGTVLF